MEPINTSTPLPDAELVHQSLRGDGEAFRTIVARYQALICSLTYSGTGRICRSEEIAQETFVTAWQSLRELREPARLRGWLCGIARNLIRSSGRRAAHDPIEIGGPLDAAEKRPAPDCGVPDHAMREEEEAILWRALARIPDTYREPLVLYYRQHRSVEDVAAALDLTVDATKQRLSRGRALLHEQVTAFVAGALEKSGPRATFTHSVMSTLPLLGASMSATGGVGTAEASASAKAGLAAGGGWFAATLGAFAALGSHIGWQMSPHPAQSEAERLWAHRFWRCAALVLAAVIFPVLFVVLRAPTTEPWVFRWLGWYLIAGYALLSAPFGIWAWENHRRLHGVTPPRSSSGSPARLLGAGLVLTALAVGGTAQAGFPNGSWTDVWLTLVFALAFMTFAVAGWELRPRRSSASETAETAKAGALRWVGPATAAMLAILVFASGERGARVSPPAILEIIEAHPNATLIVSEYERGARTLAVTVATAGGGSQRYFSIADDTLLAALARRGATYVTRRQGRDFEQLGSPGRSLFVLSIIMVSAGLVILLRGRKRGSPRFAPPARTSA